MLVKFCQARQRSVKSLCWLFSRNIAQMLTICLFQIIFRCLCVDSCCIFYCLKMCMYLKCYLYIISYMLILRFPQNLDLTASALACRELAAQRNSSKRAPRESLTESCPVQPASSPLLFFFCHGFRAKAAGAVGAAPGPLDDEAQGTLAHSFARTFIHSFISL